MEDNLFWLMVSKVESIHGGRGRRDIWNLVDHISTYTEEAERED